MTAGDPNSRSKRSRATNGVCYETRLNETLTRVRLAADAALSFADFALHQQPDGNTDDDHENLEDSA